MQGAATWREIAKNNPEINGRLFTVFVAPESEAELRERLAGRGTETQEEIERRMKTAVDEFRQADKFDFKILSTTRDNDYAALKKIYLDLKQK